MIEMKPRETGDFWPCGINKIVTAKGRSLYASYKQMEQRRTPQKGKTEMTTEKFSREIKAIKDFSFDEAHGFKAEEDGFCSEDMSFAEYCAAKDSGLIDEDRIYAAYKLGYMKAARIGIYSKRS